MTTDFTISDVLAWARTKPADAEYDYVDGGNCAMCQFLRETGRAHDPRVVPGRWTDGAQGGAFTSDIEGCLKSRRPAVWDDDGRPHFYSSFGALVERLEALCPETPVTPSNWQTIGAYLSDIEAVEA